MDPTEPQRKEGTVRLGYTLLTEQSGPRELVDYAGRAERAGFDLEVCSDHTFPWLTEQGHAAYAWSLLGAISQVTRRVELMSFVTCPTMRYHPAIVAQKAATLGVLSGGRFTLGLGSGENLNEHVIGHGWPSASVRHERMIEALQIIDSLLDGNQVDYLGHHFRVDATRLWDRPEQPVPVASAVSGSRSIRAFAPLSDAMVATQPDPDLCSTWEKHASEAGQRKFGQLPICWSRDRDVAVRRAREQFRWFAGGWSVNTELPTPRSFDAATAYVTDQDVADAIVCGPDTDAIVDVAQSFQQAGFTDLALVQVGDEGQLAFLDEAENELLPKLRDALTPSQETA